MLRRVNTWWVRSSVCLSADQFVGNLLESSGADAKRSRPEGRNGILMSVWTLGYLDHSWNQQCSERFQWSLHLHIPHNLAVTCLKFVDKECVRKRSGSELSGLTAAEFLDALHVRLPVLGSHTLENAKRIKMPGKRVAKPRERRRRNGDSMRIQIHDH